MFSAVQCRIGVPVNAFCPLAKYVHANMTNRFGFDLPPYRLRWAAAEGVSEDVIAAVLLLHECSVEEIVPQLSPLELEKVIELVGRSPVWHGGPTCASAGDSD
jgi:hypothetical protein